MKIFWDKIQYISGIRWQFRILPNGIKYIHIHTKKTAIIFYMLRKLIFLTILILESY